MTSYVTNHVTYFCDRVTEFDRRNTPVGTGLATGGAGVALVFLGAFPPVDFRAVCLLRAMFLFYQICEFP